MANTPFKMKGFSGFGNSPLEQEKKTDYITSTERSEAIRKSIKSKSNVEKSRMLDRNIDKFKYGRLKKGENYRTNMPKFMQNIAASSDTVRAILHTPDFKYIKSQ